MLKRVKQQDNELVYAKSLACVQTSQRRNTQATKAELATVSAVLSRLKAGS